MPAIPMKLPLRDRPTPPATLSTDREALHIELRGGGHLRIAHAGEGACVQLFSPDAQPVLEYNATTGDVRITGPVRHLEIEAPERGMALSSRGDISLTAQGMVRLQGTAGVRIEAAGDLGKPAALVDVGPAGVAVAAHRIGMVGAEGRVRLGHCDVSGEEMRSTWSRATWTAERLELAARDMRTKAKTLLQTVEETLTTRAGRLREWVRGSRHSQAEYTEILSEKDVRIDGTKIHLG